MMRSSWALSSSRWKAWFNERAEPRRASGAVLALVTPSTWMARKTSLLSSDLMEQKSERLAVRIHDRNVAERRGTPSIKELDGFCRKSSERTRAKFVLSCYRRPLPLQRAP